MSFSKDIKNELIEIKIKKYCCRNYFLIGLLSDCRLYEEEGVAIGEYTTVSEENCLLVERMLTGVWKTTPEKEESVRMGAPVYKLRFRLLERGKELLLLDKEDTDIFENAACEDCKKCFMRGAFVSLATISDPNTGYHFELKLKNAVRAKKMYNILTDEVSEPKIANRRNAVGLYYKSSVAIEDLMTYLGALKSVFEFINIKIERDIRNSVNRGTNCVAGNISKSVAAAQKHIAVISEIKAAGKLILLPDELFETANMRLELPSLSLSELARAHNPPISKSGLTHRLEKIIEFAEEIKNAGGEK